MEIQEKHRLKILNAKCQYVCKLDEIKNKSNYGEDIDCCANNLFLAAKLINRLECYCFSDLVLGTEEVLSKFSVSTNNTTLTPVDTFYAISVDGKYKAAYTANGTETRSEILVILLDKMKLEYTVETVGVVDTYTISNLCSASAMAYKKVAPDKTVTVTDLRVVEAGVCTTNGCHNCIENSDLNNMYEILDNLLS